MYSSRSVERRPNQLHTLRRICINPTLDHFHFRAIPEAGYITLGTIRYGLKLANGSSICTRHSSPSMISKSNNSLGGDICIPKRPQSSGPDSTPIKVNGESSFTGQHTETACKHHGPLDLESESASLSEGSNTCNHYCCIVASKIPMPWSSSGKAICKTPKSSNSEAGWCCYIFVSIELSLDTIS